TVSDSDDTPDCGSVDNASILGGQRNIQANVGAFGGVTTGAVSGGVCSLGGTSQGVITFQYDGNDGVCTVAAVPGLNVDLSAYDKFVLESVAFSGNHVQAIRVFDQDSSESISLISGFQCIEQDCTLAFSAFSSIDFSQVR